MALQQARQQQEQQLLHCRTKQQQQQGLLGLWAGSPGLRQQQQRLLRVP